MDVKNDPQKEDEQQKQKTSYEIERSLLSTAYFQLKETTNKLEKEKEMLRESEEKFVAAFKSSPNLIAITKFSNGTIIDVNEGYTQLLGYSREESIGKTTAGLSIWADPTDRTIFVDSLAKTGQIINFETALRRKDGTIVNVIDSARIIEIGGEKHVLSVVYDITERKKKEEELSRLKKAVDTSGEAIFMTDRDGIITFVNPGFTDLYGYAIDEVVGKLTPRILKSGLRKPEEYVALWSGLLTGMVVKDEHINKTKDGRLVTVASSANPIKDEQGKIIGFLAIQSDITERKQAEERLRELDILKDKFIQTVSHQMRTPLSVIRWQLENLLEGGHGTLNDYQEQLTRSCYQADLEVIARINDFVTALEIEEGRMTRIDKTPNCIENLWKSVEIKFKGDCDLKKIVYESNVPELCSPLMEIDMEKIRFVMEKLAENALIYTNNGGKITVAVKQVNANVRFEVTDTGVGIPKLEQSHIFTRFYRASNAGVMKPDASGLSLFIAKHFIEAHEGTIGFTSEEGKGSTFWFELPYHSIVG